MMMKKEEVNGHLLMAFALCGLALGAGATTYTWTGDGGDGAWETAANWSTDDATTGYPSSTDATIVFDEGATAAVTISNTALNLSSLTLVKGVELTLTNGANVTLSGAILNNGGRLLLTSNTTFTCGGTYTMTNGAYMLIRDATLTANNDRSFVWCSTAPQSDTLQIEGTKPRFTMSGYFAAIVKDAVLNINFDVSKSGYASAPLYTSKYQGMGKIWLNGFQSYGTAYVKVSASCSVKSADGTLVTVPLLATGSGDGIQTSVFKAAKEDPLPSKDSAFTGFTNGTRAIGVQIKITKGMVLIIR